MSLTYQAAVEQTITAGEQIHQIVNGTATTEVTVEDGSKVPSIRKALLDNFYFKDPIAWQVGQTENVFNQLRQFTDGSWWYAPSATASNPISMGSTPVGDPLWKIYDFDAIGKLTPQLREALRRSYAEAGYNLVDGSFEAGGTVNTISDVLLYEIEGKAYLWSGSPSKTVPAGSTPANSGGTGPGAWSDISQHVFQPLTRTQLISWASNQTIINGAVIEGDGLKYRKVDGSTAIPDFPGFEPEGVASVKHWGALGDGVADDTAELVSAITYCATKNRTLDWPKGKYLFSAIDVAVPNGAFNWTASGKAELICTSNVVGTEGKGLRLAGVASPTLHNFTTQDISLGAKTITLDSVSDISIGNLLVIRNHHCVRGDNRGSWQEGQVVQVVSLSGNSVTMDQDAYYYYRSGGNTTVTVTAATSGQSFSASAFSVSAAPRDALYHLLGLTGANAGITKMTTAYDDATKTFTVGSTVGTGFPNTPAVGDTFRLVRQAEAWAVYPATFNIVGDFHVKTSQGLITNATPGQSAWTGIIFDYCVNGTAAIASLQNFPNVGIALRGCLRCTVRDTSLYGINRVHDGDGGTGDAVAISNSSYCTVENINVGCSRRGVDITGSNWSSLYNRVRNVVMRGGGVGYAGGIIFPSSGYTEFSYGWGSHGGAAESKYEGNVAVDCYYGITLRGFNEVTSGCEIRGFSTQPIRLYYGSGMTITDTHYIDGFTETATPNSGWWKSTNSNNRKLRPYSFILMTNTYTFETPTVIKGCSAKSLFKDFVLIDTDVVAPGKIDGVSVSGCTAYIDNSDNPVASTNAYFLRINGGPAVGDNFGMGGANQMILVGTSNTIVSGKTFQASGTCEGAIRRGEGVWEMWVKANTSQSLPISKSTGGLCVDVINDGGHTFYAGVSMLLNPGSAVDASPLAATNKSNLVITATDIVTPNKMGLSIVNGRLYFNNGTATDIRATIRVTAV